MYATSTASTTSGSTRGAGAALAERRVRVVRLLRPRRAAPAFGFSLRGGREYATGFFVSKVDFNSEAHHQGLKVGDQLVSVNGYRVEDAVHSELVHYLASQTRLKIKVRHVGMLPVKDKAHESLSWQFVSERASLGSDVSSSPTLCHDTERLADMRLSILVPPRAKLGCGICKGPDWKPGIFVQFVREGGIAQEAGLRPGDQIVSCNGQDFANITFNEAISAMKAVGRLELVIREGAGTELVSPESSGYNSSASSAAGERSPAPTVVPLAPPAALRRRLASVAEEAADRADRLTLSRLKRRTWDSLDFDWKDGDIHNFDIDAPSDIEPDYDSPSIPNNPHTFENKHNLRNKLKDFITTPSNRTIINLTEDGATIQCSYDNNQSPRKSTFAPNHANRDIEKKTIVVEVHHTSGVSCPKPHCNYPPPPTKIDLDSSSISSSTTLSSAIAEEIQRRKQNKKTTNPETPAAVNPPKKTSVPKTVDNDKKKQHDALMDEFKKVHRKMFANNDGDTIKPEHNGIDLKNTDRQQTLPLRKTEYESADVATNNHQPPKREATDNPPPPPPMPTTNGHQNGDSKVTPNHKFPAKAISPEVIKTQNINKNNTLTRTPTPDYNSKTDTQNQLKLKSKDEKAELESIESYKLKNPVNVAPKPPSHYFMRAPNGTATMKKLARPVSVTIGEYAASGGSRREPTKLDFLNGDKPDGPLDTGDVPISNRLQSELALTLSRSNLRKKTDALDDAMSKRNNCARDMLVHEDSDASVDKNFHARYGNNILPLPPPINIPKVAKIKHHIL